MYPEDGGTNRRYTRTGVGYIFNIYDYFTSLLNEYELLPGMPLYQACRGKSEAAAKFSQERLTKGAVL